MPWQGRIFPELEEWTKHRRRGAVEATAPPLYVVITFQPCKVDLVDWGDEAAREKDTLLENVRFLRSYAYTLTE